MLAREERAAVTRNTRPSADVLAQLASPYAHAVEVWMTADEAEELREQVSDALLLSGFDEEYRATSEGKILEILIDKLYNRRA